MKIGWYMTDIGTLTNIGVTKGVRAPQIRSGGLKIWTPSFSDSLVPTRAKTAKKSILAQKSYGSCFSYIAHHH